MSFIENRLRIKLVSLTVSSLLLQLLSMDTSPKWRPKIQISQNQKRIPALEKTPSIK